MLCCACPAEESDGGGGNGPLTGGGGMLSTGGNGQGSGGQQGGGGTANGGGGSTTGAGGTMVGAGGAMVDPKDDVVGSDTFDAGDDPNRNDVVPGELCQRLTEIQCAAEAYCCDAPGRTIAECKTSMMAGCVDELHLDAVAMRSAVNFDAAHAATAFANFEMRASQCDPTIASWGISLSGLAGIQKGSFEVGASCKPTLFELADREAQLAALASCKDSATTACHPRMSSTLSSSWECEPRKEAGGDCFADPNCKDGLFCDNPDYDLAGATCKPRKAEGESCVAGNQCASLTCKGGSCVTATAQTAYCLK